MQYNAQPDNLAILQDCKKRRESRRLGRLLEPYNELLTANADKDKSGLDCVHTAELETLRVFNKAFLTARADHA